MPIYVQYILSTTIFFLYLFIFLCFFFVGISSEACSLAGHLGLGYLNSFLFIFNFFV
jgi:transketolase